MKERQDGKERNGEKRKKKMMMRGS